MKDYMMGLLQMPKIIKKKIKRLMKLKGDRNLISSAAPRLPHRSLQIKQFNSKAVRVIQ